MGHQPGGPNVSNEGGGGKNTPVGEAPKSTKGFFSWFGKSKKTEPTRTIETGLRAGMAAALGPTAQMRRNIGGPLRFAKVGEAPEPVKFTPSGTGGYGGYTLSLPEAPNTSSGNKPNPDDLNLVKGVNSQSYGQIYSGQNNGPVKPGQYYNRAGVLRTRKNTTPPPPLLPRSPRA